MIGCTETVTLVHHVAGINEDSYLCTVIDGVSWFGKLADAPSSTGGEAPRTEYTVRIPSDAVTDPLPMPGDFLVRGVLTAYQGKQSLKGREYFRISCVGDNRRGKNLAHVVVKNV